MKTKLNINQPIKDKLLIKFSYFKRWKRLLCISSFILSLFILLPVINLFTDDYRINLLYSKFRKYFQHEDIVRYYPPAILRRAKSIFTTPENIYIDIRHMDLQHIEYERNRAVDNVSRDFSYNPATISHGQQKIKVKLRLKGDRKIHWDSLDTSSYRVKVNGDKTLFGMKKFSLHKPRARNYIHEWIFLEIMRREGLITPRYKFVRLHINGKDLGIYAIEEHYDKHLVERHKYRDGPIIRFDEGFSEDFIKTRILPYKSKKWLSEPYLETTQKAIQLLESFRQGYLSVSEAFDREKLARFFAVVDLTDGHHGAIPKSMRFYYNPITSRLEPIPFDGHPHMKEDFHIVSELGISTKPSWLTEGYGDWFRFFFNNPKNFDQEFVAAYVKNIERMSAPEYLNIFFQETDNKLEENLDILYSELSLKDNVFSYGLAPFYFERNVYFQTQNKLNNELLRFQISAQLSTFNKDAITIQLKSLNRTFPLKVLALKCGKQILTPTHETTNFVHQLEDLNELKVKNNGKLIVDTENNSKLLPHDVIFKQPKIHITDKTSCKKLDIQMLGSVGRHTIDVMPITFNEHKIVKNDLIRGDENTSLFEFINKNDSNKTVTFLSGKHIINQNLITPLNYQINIPGGTQLYLENSSMIYARGSLNIMGSKEQPVVISSNDKTGQGISVINAEKKSILKNVKVSHLKNPAQNGWSLTGMLNFYESPVELQYVELHNNYSEDALNIIRSNFLISDSDIHDTQSDALDVDFGTGRIENTVFKFSGNDAIDVSGTELRLENVVIIDAKDKGISAGERSKIIGRKVLIHDTEIAIASKDESIINIDDVNIERSKVALAAYQKKPEYGPAIIKLDNYKSKNEGIRLVEKRSSLTVNGKYYAGNQMKIEDMLYGAIYGRSSK